MSRTWVRRRNLRLWGRKIISVHLSPLPVWNANDPFILEHAPGHKPHLDRVVGFWLIRQWIVLKRLTHQLLTHSIGVNLYIEGDMVSTSQRRGGIYQINDVKETWTISTDLCVTQEHSTAKHCLALAHCTISVTFGRVVTATSERYSRYRAINTW